ncbi:hypothetical protein D3C78_1189350 [compost metagenome]
MTRPAQGSQLPDGFHRFNANGQTFVNLIATHFGAADHRLPGFPAVALEVAGNAADGVVGVGPDINVAIAVEIHRIGAETARHELWQPHGAGVRPLERQRVDLLFPGQQQEFTQLLAEELGTWRVVETQGRQGVDHPIVAGITTKKGLDTDDRDDHLGRHAVFLLGTGQNCLMLTPEVHAAGNSRVREEHRAIFFPLLDPLGGP